MRVAVLGLGLVGGSVARALDAGVAPGVAAVVGAAGPAGGAAHTVVGHDPVEGERARADGLAVAATVEEAVDGADLVVLAAPVDANDALLGRLPAGCLVTDVGSVKEPLVRRWAQLEAPPALVPGHPMAGAESAGWAASRADLFDGARWVLCPGPWASAQQWLTVCRLVLGLGAVVVPTDPARHDRAAAAISHAPHLVAAAVAASAAAAGPLALALGAGSFRDLTRVTASPPGRTAAFCRSNALPTAAAVQDVVDRLQDVVRALLEGDDVTGLLLEGHAARARYDEARTADGGPESTSSVDDDDPDWASPLLALGASGGVVSGVCGDVLTLRGPA